MFRSMVVAVLILAGALAVPAAGQQGADERTAWNQPFAPFQV